MPRKVSRQVSQRGGTNTAKGDRLGLEGRYQPPYRAKAIRGRLSHCQRRHGETGVEEPMMLEAAGND